MLEKYLDDAVLYLEELIEITKADIENIKNADHSLVAEHTRLKSELIKKFENTKTLLDNELVKLAKANNGTDLADILCDDIKEKLSKLRESLVSLQKVNKEYAKSVIVVKEFYDSLLKSMFGSDSGSGSYGSESLSPEQLFKLRV
ncbi:flagellar export chaperone FlgN [Campylobacter fetus]|uniref:flagellar export chaperone FlgN n=1 Tax=Campylobacter fetus TaxID=196 RepID=UPI000FCC90D7|nr:flagellar export chaperone FlgN [Campylobacter fetus]QQF52628.1 flagellar biosynthesis protein FlgN [Campylobacter fetus subsp. venerealis]RUT49453.1 flagellar biosynthesis protein FlgN [Campylobacter fetus]RUT49712.1 flagellar biosynthesis protein FlgN [Campylobacter fetus]